MSYRNRNSEYRAAVYILSLRKFYRMSEYESSFEHFVFCYFSVTVTV